MHTPLSVDVLTVTIRIDTRARSSITEDLPISACGSRQHGTLGQPLPQLLLTATVARVIVQGY
jgi:hypothetical protein